MSGWEALGQGRHVCSQKPGQIPLGGNSNQKMNNFSTLFFQNKCIFILCLYFDWREVVWRVTLPGVNKISKAIYRSADSFFERPKK